MIRARFHATRSLSGGGVTAGYVTAWGPHEPSILEAYQADFGVVVWGSLSRCGKSAMSAFFAASENTSSAAAKAAEDTKRTSNEKVRARFRCIGGWRKNELSMETTHHAVEKPLPFA